MYTYRGHFIGIAARLVGLFAFSLMSIGFVTLSKQLPVFEQMFVVYIITTLVLTPLYIYRKRALKRNGSDPNFANPNTISTNKSLIYYFVRASLGTLGMLCWINAVKQIGGAEASLVMSLVPIFVMLLGTIFKQEKINTLSLLGAVICFSVTGFALNTAFKLLTIGFVLALSATLIWSFYWIICKIQSKTEDSVIQSYYTFCASIIIMAPFIDYGIIRNDLILTDLVPLTTMGLLRISNIMLIFVSLKLTSMAMVMLAEYSQFVFMAISDYFIKGVEQSTMTWIACAVVTVVSALLAHYQGKKLEGSSQKGD